MAYGPLLATNPRSTSPSTFRLSAVSICCLDADRSVRTLRANLGVMCSPPTLASCLASSRKSSGAGENDLFPPLIKSFHQGQSAA